MGTPKYHFKPNKKWDKQEKNMEERTMKLINVEGSDTILHKVPEVFLERLMLLGCSFPAFLKN